jgi:hypothetical protein
VERARFVHVVGVAERGRRVLDAPRCAVPRDLPDDGPVIRMPPTPTPTPAPAPAPAPAPTMRVIGSRHLSRQVRGPVAGRQLVQTHHGPTATRTHAT